MLTAEFTRSKPCVDRGLINDGYLEADIVRRSADWAFLSHLLKRVYLQGPTSTKLGDLQLMNSVAKPRVSISLFNVTLSIQALDTYTPSVPARTVRFGGHH